jgi:Family of unknown function (DUF6353)
MSIKSLANKATSAVGRQMLTVQKHSPVLLFGVGAVGVVATAVLTARATLKLSEVLDQGEESLNDVALDGKLDENAKKKASYGVKLQTAVNVAKLYTPAVVVGVLTVGALTGSHVILQRRNAGLAAAYAAVDQSFKNYRSRVVEDQGKQKDFEYLHGVTEREIAEEGPNGIETKVIRGLDAEAMKKNGTSMYSRIFDETNPNWSKVPHQNQMFLTSQMTYANMRLRSKGKVYLNDVYDMLGLERSDEGQVVGWVDNSENGDSYIDFGVWNGSVYDGMEWVTGSQDGIMLDFNVDGLVLDLLKKK